MRVRENWSAEERVCSPPRVFNNPLVYFLIKSEKLVFEAKKKVGIDAFLTCFISVSSQILL